jgi:seryl-tRNA synthetase
MHRDRMGNAEHRGDAEINARIKSLNNLITRISGMKNLSDAQKAELTASLQAQISSLTTLKAKIDSGTATSSLSTDIKSITQGNRVYALVMPKTEVLAAVDRLNTLIASLKTIAGKLQTRITEAQGKGVDVGSSTAKLADLNAKLTDATTQAQNAQAAVINLTPDNGDQSVIDSNKAALRTANTALKAAEKDVKIAGNDSREIVKTLGIHIDTQVTASTTASTTTQ